MDYLSIYKVFIASHTKDSDSTESRRILFKIDDAKKMIYDIKIRMRLHRRASDRWLQLYYRVLEYEQYLENLQISYLESI